MLREFFYGSSRTSSIDCASKIWIRMSCHADADGNGSPLDFMALEARHYSKLWLTKVPDRPAAGMGDHYASVYMFYRSVRKLYGPCVRIQYDYVRISSKLKYVRTRLRLELPGNVRTSRFVEFDSSLQWFVRRILRRRVHAVVIPLVGGLAACRRHASETVVVVQVWLLLRWALKLSIAQKERWHRASQTYKTTTV
jgi:hypothetical protein